MKLHIIAALGLSLASGAVLAQTGALPSTPVTGPTKDTQDSPAKAPVDITPNDDGTLGGTISGGAEGANGTANATIDPEQQKGTISGKGSLANAEFGKLDVNQNGSLTRDEMRSDTKLLSQFNKLDNNGDGKVDKNEYQLSLRQKVSPDSSEKSSSDKAKEDKATKEDKAKDRNQPGDILPGG